MDKVDWKHDTFLRVRLADTYTAPKAVGSRKKEKKYKFVIKPKSIQNGGVYVKRDVPEFGLEIVKNMLDNDETVERYFYEEQ